MSDHLQTEYNGYIIRWSDLNRRFNVLDKEMEQQTTQKGFKSIADAVEWIGRRSKISYRRVPILARNSQWSSHEPRCPGEATSPVDDDQAWLSFANPKSRYKEYLHRIWLDTPDNRRLLEMVNERKEQVKNLETQIRGLEESAVKLTIEDFTAVAE